jgi:MFS family permease
MVMVTNFLDSPLIAVILPVYVHQVYGSSVELGLLLGAFGGASLIGAVIYGIIGPRLPRRLTFGVAFIVVGLPFWILTLSPPFPVALAALAVTGLAAGPLNPIINTVMFERVPRQMRGRVMGALTSGAYVAIPLGMLLAGFISERFGVITAVVFVAAGYLLITLATFLNPAMREMDRPPAVTPQNA